jgi:hypothetical protein
MKMKNYSTTIERALSVFGFLILVASCTNRSEDDNIGEKPGAPIHAVNSELEHCYMELSKLPFSFNAVPDSMTALVLGRVYMSRYFGLVDSTKRMTVSRTTQETWLITCPPEDKGRGQYELEIDGFSGEVLYFNDLEDV